MGYERRRGYDDRDGFDDLPARRKNGGKTMLPVWLAVGGLGLLMLMCTSGIVVLGVAAVLPKDSHPDEFVGSWKGRFFLRGQQLDIIYTFDKAGGFREEDFNLQGARVNATGGTWRFDNGEIEIDFDNGVFEAATATFIDNNTINYRIVDHDDQAQIGTGTTFRRQ
jgi:hypothetical protein